MWEKWRNWFGDSNVRLHGLSAAGLVFAAALLLRQTGFLMGTELSLYDAFLRDVQPREAGSPVLLVEINEDDIQALGHWPVSDRVLTRALRDLLGAGAQVVGIDLYRDLPVPPGNQGLSNLLRDEDRIVATRKFGGPGESRIPGPPALEGSDRVGFNDIPLDGNAVVRRALLYQDDGVGEPEPSFALQVATLALADRGVALTPDPDRPEWLRLGETSIPYFEATDGGYVDADDAGYQMLVDFAAHEALEVMSLSQVLGGELGTGALEGRVVVLGSNAESLPDHSPVPMGLTLPRVALHAHAVDQLLRYAAGRSAPIRHLEEWQELALLALACLAGGLFGFGGPGRPLLGAVRFVLGLAVGVLSVLAAAALAFRYGTWVPVAGPCLAGVAAAGLATAWASSRERWQRNQLMQLFGAHNSPLVASEIWAHRDEVLREGRIRPRRLTATVLFVDMRGYTTQSEKMEPDELMAWSNAFMERMAALVDKHHGIVDDYFGDGIKANFGVPLERRTPIEIAETARDAVRCALEMNASLAELNAAYEAQGLPTCAAKIGIHTGSVVIGSIGVRHKRIKYTTVGSVPVTAQRLESTREVPHDYAADPVRILVSEATHHLLGDEFETTPQGEVVLSGQTEPMAVHRIETVVEEHPL